MRALPVRRGCGSRKAGGVYIESGLGPNGVPLEDLMVDPPLGEGQIGTPEWFKPHRTPLMLEASGVWHLILWVGAEYYPNVWDFLEEVRVAGASRRVPKSLDFSKLTPASRMIFVHPQALLDADIPDAYCPCPKQTHTFASEPRCLGGAKYLPMRDAEGYVTETNGLAVARTLPCGHSYAAYALPDHLRDRMQHPRPGVFVQMAITGVALVEGKDGEFDPDTEARVRQAGVEVFRTDA